MSSFTYDHYYYHLSKGDINPSSDTFKALLVTSSYAPNKATHESLSDITNEVSGTGYTAGGNASAATVAIDTSTHKITVAFAGVSWPTSTITARGVVLYKVGSDAAHSYLVGYGDFVTDKSETASTFAVSFDTPVTIDNS